MARLPGCRAWLQRSRSRGMGMAAVQGSIKNGQCVAWGGGGGTQLEGYTLGGGGTRLAGLFGHATALQLWLVTNPVS